MALGSNAAAVGCCNGRRTSRSAGGCANAGRSMPDPVAITVAHPNRTKSLRCKRSSPWLQTPTPTLLGKTGDVNRFNPVCPTREKKRSRPNFEMIRRASRPVLYGIPHVRELSHSAAAMRPSRIFPSPGKSDFLQLTFPPIPSRRKSRFSRVAAYNLGYGRCQSQRDVRAEASAGRQHAVHCRRWTRRLREIDSCEISVGEAKRRDRANR
jgi:hypothetical protein